MLLCAECARCGQRSILSGHTAGDRPRLAEGETQTQEPAAPASLRCDMCGSRRVRVVEIATPFDAIAFVAKRGSGQ
ncbi:hypothetical protein ACI7BZ_14705 [Xanthobacter sp. AM11]|uniref:hypothetical protein n=1 Tax=Xanthobacter sp. AM11 TaxID=3380643 RepID=UPI0039BF0E7F